MLRELNPCEFKNESATAARSAIERCGGIKETDSVICCYHNRDRNCVVRPTVSVYSKEAVYCIRVPALGHVAEGAGTNGLILPFEFVEAGVEAT